MAISQVDKTITHSQHCLSLHLNLCPSGRIFYTSTPPSLPFSHPFFILLLPRSSLCSLILLFIPAVLPSSGQVRGGEEGGEGELASLSGASSNLISQQREEGLVVTWAFVIVHSTRRSFFVDTGYEQTHTYTPSCAKNMYTSNKQASKKAYFLSHISDVIPMQRCCGDCRLTSSGNRGS